MQSVASAEMTKPPCPRGTTTASKTTNRHIAGGLCFYTTVDHMIPQPDLGQQASLIESLSNARLAKFRAVFGGRDRDAIELYVIDTELVSSLHAVVRTVEVALREAMHTALAAEYGSRWFDTQESHLDRRTVSMISEAKIKLGRQPAPGKVVAQLMLGTWTSLLDRGGSLVQGGRADYENHLWEPALERVFCANGQAPTRAEIHSLTQSINWARNRINHCEPVVFGFPQRGHSGTSQVQDRHSPARVLDDMRTLMGYMNGPLQSWLSVWGDVNDLVAHPKVELALAHAATLPRVRIVH